jgi:hypothetical protein
MLIESIPILMYIVVEHLHAPLYPFSAIELGHDVATVEACFKQMLDLTSQWGAVLLLDEAVSAHLKIESRNGNTRPTKLRTYLWSRDP